MESSDGIKLHAWKIWSKAIEKIELKSIPTVIFFQVIPLITYYFI